MHFLSGHGHGTFKAVGLAAQCELTGNAQQNKHSNQVLPLQGGPVSLAQALMLKALTSPSNCLLFWQVEMVSVAPPGVMIGQMQLNPRNQGKGASNMAPYVQSAGNLHIASTSSHCCMSHAYITNRGAHTNPTLANSAAYALHTTRYTSAAALLQ